MGLIYQFSTDINDHDHVKAFESSIMLRSYGLPAIFWLYLILGLMALSLLTIAVWPSVMKILESKQMIDQIIGLGLLITIFFIVTTFITFFFL